MFGGNKEVHHKMSGLGIAHWPEHDLPVKNRDLYPHRRDLKEETHCTIGPPYIDDDVIFFIILDESGYVVTIQGRNVRRRSGIRNPPIPQGSFWTAELTMKFLSTARLLDMERIVDFGEW